MSLIEVLIASGILLAIAVGILPLLMRALANNVRGWEATVVSNETKTELDHVISGPLDGPEIVVPPGSDILSRQQSWAEGAPGIINDPDEGWHDNAPDPPTDKGTILWDREIRVRQYNLSDLDQMPVGALGDEGILHYVVTPTALENNARDGGTITAFVHIKQVEIEAEGKRESGALGMGQKLYVRMLKAY